MQDNHGTLRQHNTDRFSADRLADRRLAQGLRENWIPSRRRNPKTDARPQGPDDLQKPGCSWNHPWYCLTIMIFQRPRCSWINPSICLTKLGQLFVSKALCWPAGRSALFKQLVPGNSFQTICPRQPFSNNLPRPTLFKQFVPGGSFQTMSRTTDFKQFAPGRPLQTICRPTRRSPRSGVPMRAASPPQS